MRTPIAAAALLTLATLAFTTPARAGTPEEISKHGMVVTIADMEFDLTFTPDGKFTDKSGQLTGTWKIDGAKLCTTSNFDPSEQCAEYPADKKSGDTFDLVTPGGTLKIHIK